MKLLDDEDCRMRQRQEAPFDRLRTGIARVGYSKRWASRTQPSLRVLQSGQAWFGCPAGRLALLIDSPVRSYGAALSGLVGRTGRRRVWRMIPGFGWRFIQATSNPGYAGYKS
jgi:hypothetical protein